MQIASETLGSFNKGHVSTNPFCTETPQGYDLQPPGRLNAVSICSRTTHFIEESLGAVWYLGCAAIAVTTDTNKDYYYLSLHGPQRMVLARSQSTQVLSGDQLEKSAYESRKE